MSSGSSKETMIDQLVTYTIDLDGRLIVIEHVPARVHLETGEQYFSPQTVERIHEIIRSQRKPARTITTPVYDFAA
jgi:YgiT-type zinc finger domain-containing protein